MSEQAAWTPVGYRVEPPTTKVIPAHSMIFIEWDCAPLSFAFVGSAGQFLYAHWIDEPHRFLVVPTTREMLVTLERNEIDLRTILESDAAIVLDLGPDGETVMRAWRTRTSDIPADCLPVPGVKLCRELASAE